MTNNELKNTLQEIANQRKNSIEKAVAIEALHRSYDEIKNFFSDLRQSGCISGMIGSLVYTHDTHAFFYTHYYQIEEIRKECEDSLGEPITIQGDLINFLAWFAFEQTAYNMAQEFGLEI